MSPERITTRIAQFFTIFEYHAMVFVMCIAVDDTIGSEQQRAFLSGFILCPVFSISISQHLHVDTLGIVHYYIIGIGIPPQSVVIVIIGRFAAVEIAQMDGELGIRRQSLGNMVVDGIDARFGEVENQVELHIGGVVTGKIPILVFQIVSRS